MPFTTDLDDDLFDVQSDLIPVTAKWRSIGTALRLKADVLESIQAGSGSDPPACLASMVTEWLRRNYNVKRFGEPTWQRLVKAVGHPAGGGNTAVARDIARRHKAGGKLRPLSVSTHVIIAKSLLKMLRQIEPLTKTAEEHVCRVRKCDGCPTKIKMA